MSLSMSIPGQFDHPDLQRAVDTIAESAAKHGKVDATLAPTEKWGHDFIDRGYRMVSYSYDIGLLANSLAAGINALKAR
jgi:2-keto-3-deoxy-L-rhamnonate aldolase RhmA